MEIPQYEQDQLEAGRLLFCKQASFERGISHLRDVPPTTMPEVAFIGRSNVGKSSLMNALTGRKQLARVSHTPGRTRELNFFNLSETLMLVDLPGYGYAKVSRKDSNRWNRLVVDYFANRRELAKVFILIDARHGVKESDLEIMEVLDEIGVPFHVILTKVDKCSAKDLQQRVIEMEAATAKFTVAQQELIKASSRKKQGIAELRALIALLVE